MLSGLSSGWVEFLMTGKLRAKREWIYRSGLAVAATALLIGSCAALAAFAGGPVNETALRSAWSLYNAQKYRESSDAFEALIASSTPNARLYYYAALANRACNRTARAKQLCQYISTTFASAPEAAYAQKLYPSAVQQTASSGESGSEEAEPVAFKGKSPEELLQTPEGRKYLATKMAKQAVASATSPMKEKSKGGKQGERVFSASDIAKDGAGGIDQMFYPNCWFESSMSALASLPRGQRLMSDMVRFGPKEGSYIVRFPGDGTEYLITEEELDRKGVHDKALWATLIECAQTQKFPDDNGAPISAGLAHLTGQKAEVLTPSDASDQEISLFIDGAVKSQNPIVCGSNHYTPEGLPNLVVTGHAYTVIGFEPASGLVKIRNPHGRNSRRFALKSDPNHQKFEQLDDGVFKIHISLFKQYFHSVARAFI